ncbi:nuclear transport factor 2 family protein [Leifsonia kafniensis]|uniref:Nuclear transport factor 2 family protein n=1 Tax=Leifsonia kafniensis TaxID=475957 RepID=A0ABP7L1J0_9MICO
MSGVGRGGSVAASTSDAVLADAVLAAADAIIADFGHHRRDAYFSGFANDATFVFHTAPDRLESRAAYEELWDEWERSAGFRVHSCVSTNRRVQVLGTAAVFSHNVETTLEMDGAVETVHERETIVFELRDGQWLAVHEHLSARSE